MKLVVAVKKKKPKSKINKGRTNGIFICYWYLHFIF